MAENIVIEFSAETSDIDAAFSKLQDNEKKISQGAKQTTGEFDKLNASIKNVGVTAAASLTLDKSKDIKKSVDAVDSLKKRIAEAVRETQNLAAAYGALDPRTQAAAKNAANLKDELNKVNKQIDALNPGAKFNAFIQVAGNLTGGLAAAQGAMALFGAESEDAQKTLVKLAGALNLAQGLNAIAGLSDSVKNLKSVLGLTQVATQGVTVATKGMAAANVTAATTANTATVATKGFTSALTANPIFLAVAAVTALTTAFVLLGDDIDEAEESLNNLNKSFQEFDNQSNIRSRNAKEVVDSIQDEIDILKAKGENLVVIADKEKELLTTKIGTNKSQIAANELEIESIRKLQDERFRLGKLQGDAGKEEREKSFARIQELINSNRDIEEENKRHATALKIIDINLSKELADESKKRGADKVKQEKNNDDDILKAKQSLAKRIRDLNTSLIEDEFARSEQELKDRFDDEIDIYAEQADKKLITLEEFNKLYTKREEKLTADLLALEKRRADLILKQDDELGRRRKAQAEKDAQEVAEAVEYWDEYTQKKREEKLLSTIDGTVNFINSLAEAFSQGSARKIEALDEELEAVLSIYDKEAKANQDLFNKKIISEKEFSKVEEEIQKKREASEEATRKKKNEIARRELNIKKAAASFEAIVNTAIAVTKALKDGGIPLALLVAAAGAIEVATIQAQQPPKFAKGTLSVPGHGNQDTVHALLTPGEAVIPQREAREYRPSLSAIYHRKIKPKDLNELVEWKLKGGNTNVTATIDHDKLASAIVWQMNVYGKKGVHITNWDALAQMISGGSLYKRGI